MRYPAASPSRRRAAAQGGRKPVAEPGVVASARGSAGRLVGTALRGCRGLIVDWARTLPLERMVLRLVVAPGWRMGLFDEGRRCADEVPFLKPLSHAPFPQEVQSTLPPLPGGPPPGRTGSPGGPPPGRTGSPGGPPPGRTGSPVAPVPGRHAGGGGPPDRRRVTAHGGAARHAAGPEGRPGAR